MDSLDEQLIEILKKDSRTPYVEIAEKVNLSEAAVRRRVQNLINGGVIRRFTVDTTLKKAATAMAFISVRAQVPVSSLLEGIKRVRGVMTVFEVSGEHQIAVLFSAPSMTDLSSSIDEIRKFDGVDATKVSIILRELS